MGNLRQSMTEEEWNEMGMAVDRSLLLNIIDTTGEPNILNDMIDHPNHYGGADNPYEAIKVIDSQGWGTGFALGNALKYIMRAGKKSDNAVEDLEKAKWYIQHAIELYSNGSK